MKEAGYELNKENDARTVLIFLLVLVASHQDCLISSPVVGTEQLEGSEPAAGGSRSIKTCCKFTRFAVGACGALRGQRWHDTFEAMQ